MHSSWDKPNAALRVLEVPSLRTCWPYPLAQSRWIWCVAHAGRLEGLTDDVGQALADHHARLLHRQPPRAREGGALAGDRPSLAIESAREYSERGETEPIVGS